MSSPFVAEIRIFGFSFAPRGWATCDGQLLAISQNTALFSLLGTTYGGDGKSTFGLPNFQGSAPMQQGQGAGLSQRFLGETGGEAAVTLLQNEMPVHNHGAQGAGGSGMSSPSGNTWGGALKGQGLLYAPANSNAPAPMSLTALAVTGGSASHNNLMPYLTLLFCIALQGIFPQRP